MKNIEEKYEVCVMCKKMKLKKEMFYDKSFDEWECIECINQFKED